METITAFFANLDLSPNILAGIVVPQGLWLYEIALITAIIFSGLFTARHIKQWIFAKARDSKFKRRIVRASNALVFPLISLTALWATMGVGGFLALSFPIITVAANLTIAWVVARTASQLIKNPALAKTLSFFAWSGIALHLVGWLSPIIEYLNNITFTLSGFELTAWTVMMGVAQSILFVWGAVIASRIIDSILDHAENLTPTVRVLLNKISSIVLFSIAGVLVITGMGVDLTIFAVFGGALGIGVGFGLQKVVSNLISGMMILIDGSIKPGDVIAIEGTYGRVERLGTRYVSVVTRDKIEHLVPNEDFITRGVANWTYSDTNVRLRIPVGVSYDTKNIESVMDLCVDAAMEVDRVLDNPPPRCRITSLGDNAINLEIRGWICDAHNGIGKVKSEIYINLLNKFEKAGIEIPYPQTDIHIKE
jgi:small-conductance mechanosensitive channel